MTIYRVRAGALRKIAPTATMGSYYRLATPAVSRMSIEHARQQNVWGEQRYI